MPSFGRLARDEDGEERGQELEAAHEGANPAGVLFALRRVEVPVPLGGIGIFETPQERLKSRRDSMRILDSEAVDSFCLVWRMGAFPFQQINTVWGVRLLKRLG